MSDNKQTCKLAYAANGDLICDPKQKKTIQGEYKGQPSCNDGKCTVYGKSCRENKIK